MRDQSFSINSSTYTEVQSTNVIYKGTTVSRQCSGIKLHLKLLQIFISAYPFRHHCS